MAKYYVSGNTVTKGTPSKKAPSKSVKQQISDINSGLSNTKNPSNINPRDVPGYVPGTLPGDRLRDGSVSGATSPTAAQPTAQPAVNTAQPSPETTPTDYTVQQGDTLSQIAQAQGVPMSNISGYRSGNPNLIYPGEQLSLGDKYKQGLANVKQAGLESPTSAAVGSYGVQASMPGEQAEAPSLLGGMMETDSNFDSIFTMYDDFMSPVKQRDTLLQEYKKMSKSLGIEGMNEELIDAKRIIEGTEDDIRSEVTATGGFATDSQVLALANSRNKSLVKNYNYLLESRDNAMTQLSTMMDLSIQDRQFAESEFDRKMNFAFKVQEFKERAQANATTQFKYLIDNGFGAALLTNPYETQLAEKTLGIPRGGLAQIIAQQQQDRALALEKGELQNDVLRSNLETDKAQRYYGLLRRIISFNLGDGKKASRS